MDTFSEITTNRPRSFFPTNPDLADMLRKTDLDFGNLYFWDIFGPKLPDLQTEAWAGLGPGPWAGQR